MASKPDEQVGEHEVLFEFQRFGRSVRVAAIEPRSNTEVVVIGTADAGEGALKAAALRKLRYVLARRRPER
jgi:hypothetical protein